MANMGKRVSLGVRKKKIPNKPNKKITKKKLFLKKVVDYLKSDSYLFTSLISSSSDYRSLKGIEIKEKHKKESKTNFVKKLGEYFMSDSFMYSPMLFVPSKSIHTPPRETQPLINSSTAVELVRRSISVRDKNHLANDMKSAVYQNCRLPTISEKGLPGSEIRKRF